MANESKHERFKRLAEQRTNIILDRLRVLGNCANKSAYEYTEQDVKKIFNTIEADLQLIKAKFKNSRKQKFEL